MSELREDFRGMVHQRADETKKGSRFLMNAGTAAVGILVALGIVKMAEGNRNVSAQEHSDSAPHHEKKSARVQEMQEKLSALGYDLTADGINGAHTRTQVYAFQSNNGLSPTGDLNSKTVRAIRNQYADMLRTKKVAARGSGSKIVRTVENVPGAAIGFVGDVAEGIAKELP